MKRLARKDIPALLSALEDLHSDLSAETLPQRAVSAVAGLISAEITAFDGFDLQGEYAGFSWHNPANAVTTGEMEIFAQLIGEHPLFVETVEKQRFDAMKITDFYSVAQFRDTTIYNEFYRRVGVNRQMTIALPVSAGLMLLCALSRSQRDFSERDRDLLNLIAPHFVSAYRNAQMFQRAKQSEAVLQTVCGAVSQGVIVLGDDGRVRFASEAAAKFIEKYFADEKSPAGFLPEKLARFVEHYKVLFENAKEFYKTPAPLIIKGETGELRVNLSFNNQSQEVILLLEAQEKLSPEKFVALGLTKREAEILYWLAQGKTNIEIGMICGISWRTVQKHAEHICEKLGAETRTAAVTLALDKLSRIVH